MEKVSLEKAQKLFTDNGIYFVIFTTEWCPDCKMIKKQVEELIFTEKYTDKPIRFLEIDAEKANLFHKIENDWNVSRVPSVYLVKNNKRQLIGLEYVSKPQIQAAISKILTE